ncbi:MAG: CDP-alcohol phosphatidyltransferase family protein [Candidatus Kapabacteria bacterium]|nr:CDP-alcohol phosphatidyltransferase family protein [Candidatus Kapabacteria bacterium]
MWTISNIISISRMIAAIPMAFFMFTENSMAILLMAIFACISDVGDGFIARKFNQVSEWGKILDPLADKIFVGTMVIVLIIQNKMPLWFALAIIARDLIILIGGMYAKKKLHYVLPSNWIGKLSVTIIALTILAVLFSFPLIAQIGIWLSLTAMIISLVFYFQRAYNLIRN